MRYLLQVYFNGAQERLAQLPDDERQAMVSEYIAFGLAPEIQDGNQLQPPTTAIAVRVRDGEPVTTDGPFSATGEPLGATTSSTPTASTPRSSSPPASRQRGWAAPSRSAPS